MESRISISPTAGFGEPNALYHNRGGRQRFEDVAAQRGGWRN